MAKAKQAQQAADAKTVTIKLTRSPIGFNKNQATVVESIGLRRINHSVTLADTPETRGMIFKVRHLVTVSE
ncbi:MAG: 50S ribosomal protein L30 [Vicinamibacterales bacterium]